MVPTYVQPYRNSEEIRVGWASWDRGFQDRSIKFAYKDASGKISRGCPELPFDVLVDMVIVAKKQGELSKEDEDRIRKAFEL